MESTGIHTIRGYILRWQATIAEKVACHLIYELYAKAERSLGKIQMVIWWDQDVVNGPEEYT